MTQLNFLNEMAETAQVSSDIFDFRPAIFDKTESDRYLKVFLETVPWSQAQQKMYGKQVTTPRLTSWFGDPNTDYNKEGSGTPPLPWTSELLEIKVKIEALSGISFNSVLMNLYRDENDGVSWHSDKDGVEGRNKYVASVSFGQERHFDLRKKNDPSKKFSVLLEHGSYLLMRGEFQEQWLHRIAKSTVAMGPRVNLTFRISREKHERS